MKRGTYSTRTLAAVERHVPTHGAEPLTAKQISQRLWTITPGTASSILAILRAEGRVVSVSATGGRGRARLYSKPAARGAA